jgi:hypothetical protein
MVAPGSTHGTDDADQIWARFRKETVHKHRRRPIKDLGLHPGKNPNI